MIELAPKHKFGLPIASPVLPAAGVFGFGDEYRDLVDYRCLGALITNPVSLHSRKVARPPRLGRHGDAFITHTGYPNPGLRRVLRDYRTVWARLPIPVIVHVIATTPADVAEAAQMLVGVQNVLGLELGLDEDTNVKEALALLAAAQADGELPVLVRLPFGEADVLALPLAQAGADALTFTAPPRAVLPYTSDDDSVRTLMRGRLYSPSLYPLLLHRLSKWITRLSAPVIACGGIATPEEALICLEFGAAAVQIDAIVWRDPSALERIARDMGKDESKMTQVLPANPAATKNIESPTN